VTGPVFGRHVLFGTEEATYWINPFKVGRVGLAAFADTANASARIAGAEGEPFQVDGGLGVRVRIPGGTLRVDYARGLRDNAHAVTFGFSWFD
jgi:outer membrane translocation and assembly module TamA